MPRGWRHCWCSLLFVIVMCGFSISALAQSLKPKVRAITAFIRLEPAQYQQQIAETLKMLRAAKAEFERGGYEVESVRITHAAVSAVHQGNDRRRGPRLVPCV